MYKTLNERIQVHLYILSQQLHILMYEQPVLPYIFSSKILLYQGYRGDHNVRSVLFQTDLVVTQCYMFQTLDEKHSRHIPLSSHIDDQMRAYIFDQGVQTSQKSQILLQLQTIILL